MREKHSDSNLVSTSNILAMIGNIVCAIELLPSMTQTHSRNLFHDYIVNTDGIRVALLHVITWGTRRLLLEQIEELLPDLQLPDTSKGGR